MDTGLYSDFASKTLAPGIMEFAPANILWADGAEKHRYVKLPPGGQIDTSIMDHWVFPVGTQFWKEFDLEGMRLETRLIWRVADTGMREVDTIVGAYVWNDDESDATFIPGGEDNLRGTPHDAPSSDTCWRCHVGEAGHVLGFSALQLGDVSALPLSNPPPAGTMYAAPNAAEGYLHANCGHCHNPNGGAWPDSNMILRLDVTETDPATTMLVQSTVGVPLEQWVGHGYTDRIVAGDPSSSAIVYRMSQRGNDDQMPPVATEFVDDAGLAMITAWIQSL
jgi:mono/diheme cytochrome c family protein